MPHSHLPGPGTWTDMLRKSKRSEKSVDLTEHLVSVTFKLKGGGVIPRELGESAPGLAHACHKTAGQGRGGLLPFASALSHFTLRPSSQSPAPRLLHPCGCAIFREAPKWWLSFWCPFKTHTHTQKTKTYAMINTPFADGHGMSWCL